MNYMIAGWLLCGCMFPGFTDTMVSSSVSYTQPKIVGRIKDERIRECSGLAVSRIQPVIWTHNDSGGGPSLYALKGNGELAAVLTLKGVRAQDWEDIAIGPGPKGTTTLYVGDIGDNYHGRPFICVYIFQEPKLNLEAAPKTWEVSNFICLRLTYPDGAHDAEALMVDPETGGLYILTKEVGARTTVFFTRLPEEGTQAVLTKLATCSLGRSHFSPLGKLVTAGDISPSGDKVLVRTYQYVYLFSRPEGKPLSAAFSASPVLLPAPPESQGEAIGFSKSGVSYFTISEGVNAPVYRVDVKTKASAEEKK